MFTIKKVEKKVVIKRAASISLLAVFSLAIFYVLFSPVLISVTQPGGMNSVSSLLYSLSPFQVAMAATSAATSPFTVTLTVGKEITITSPGTLALTGTINGITGGSATGSTSLAVVNSSAAGFTMSMAASTSPAMQMGGTGTATYQSFANYQSTATPDYTWINGGAGVQQFGFSVGADALASAAQAFRSTASACNASPGTTNSITNCFAGFNALTSTTIVAPTTFNTTGAGSSTETIFFEAQRTSGSTNALESGAYQATITVTANTN
jgi:hypothetical protein